MSGGENVTRKVKDGIILAVNIILIISLSISVFVIFRINNDLKAAKKESANKQTTIEQQEEVKRELESKITTTEGEKKALEEKNAQLEGEKSKLESENSKLKAEIKELKAAKAPPPAPVIQNPKPTGKICYLTFDDGPTANTLKILNILEQYEAKATFFVIDTSTTKIEYVKQIHEKGHTVGLHSSSHNYSAIYKSTDAYFADLNAISEKVKSYIGVESKVIRFPGGGSNTTSKKYCKGIMTALASQVTEKGYTYFDWNVSSGDADAKLASRTQIERNVLNGAKGKNSICVLMHDAPGKSTTVDALPNIITGLREQGFEFKVLTPDCHGYHHAINN